MLLDAQGVSIQREERRSSQIGDALASLKAAVRHHTSEAAMCHEATAVEDKLRAEVRVLRREARMVERQAEEAKKTSFELREEATAAKKARQSRNGPQEAALSEVRAAVASALVQQRPALCAKLRDEILQRLPDLEIDSKKAIDASQGFQVPSVGRFTEERAKSQRSPADVSAGARRRGLSERTGSARAAVGGARPNHRSASPALRR